MADNQIQWAITFRTDGVDSAMARVRELSDETTQSVAAGWNRANATAIEGLKTLQSQSEQTGSRTRAQIEKASNAASLLGELLGIKIPDALQKVLADSEVAGPALEAALEPLAAIALAQAIVQIIFKVEDLIDSWRNLSQEEKLAIDQAAADTQSAIDFGRRVVAIRREAALIGKSEVEQARLRAKFADEDAREDEGFLKRARKKYEAAKKIVDLEGATRKGDSEHNDPYFTNPKTGIRTYTDVPLVSDDQLKKAKAEIRELEDLYGKGLQDLKRASLLSAEKRALAEKQAQQAIFEAQARRFQVITLQAQKDEIKALHEGNQEEISDYKASFAAINAAAQQFNNQQLSILMTGINRNSAQIIQASQQRFKKLEQNEAASLERRRKAFDRVFHGISGSFTNFINGMMSGNQTLGQAWARMVNDMAAKFLSGLERQLMGFVEHKLMEVTIHANAEAAKDEASKAAHAKEDSRTAFGAAKIAFKQAQDLGPVIGPIMAPIAAAAAFAGVMAFGSAEGGQYIVPSEQLTMLHRNEMVLPAGVADRMRGVIESGGGRGVTVVVNHSVNAVDAESFHGHLRRHSHMIANEVARALKRRGIVRA